MRRLEVERIDDMLIRGKLRIGAPARQRAGDMRIPGNRHPPGLGPEMRPLGPQI